MMMTSRFSKLMLTVHITFSVGWLGTVVGFLALALAGLTGDDQLVRACYLAMELIAWFVIVPFCIGSLLTGLIQSLGTHWGLFNHYWLVVKLILTVIATIVLLLHMQPISHLATVAADTTLSFQELRSLRIRLVADAGAALMVLLATTTLSVYKPWGKIEYSVSLPRFQTGKKSLKLLLIGFVSVIILFIILHLIEGGFGAH